MLTNHSWAWSFPGASDSKESSCKAGDQGLIPGWGGTPGEGKTHSSILAWRIPRTEEPGGLQSRGSQRDVTEQLTLSLSLPFLGLESRA